MKVTGLPPLWDIMKWRYSIPLYGWVVWTVEITNEYYAVRLHFNDMLMVATTSKLRTNIVDSASPLQQWVQLSLIYVKHIWLFYPGEARVWRGWQDVFLTWPHHDRYTVQATVQSVVQHNTTHHTTPRQCIKHSFSLSVSLSGRRENLMLKLMIR